VALKNLIAPFARYFVPAALVSKNQKATYLTGASPFHGVRDSRRPFVRQRRVHGFRGSEKIPSDSHTAYPSERATHLKDDEMRISLYLSETTR